MMRSWTVLQCFLLIFILVVVPFAVADDYDESGESWAQTTSSSTEGDDDSWGDAGAAGETSTDFTEEDPGFSLYLGMRLYCHISEDNGRDIENVFVAGDEVEKESYVYTDDFFENIASYDVLFPFLPYDSDYSFATSSLFDEEDRLYTWSSESIRVTTTSEDPFENAKIHRFEGETEEDTDQWETWGCIPWVGALTRVGISDDNPTGTTLTLDVDESGSVVMTHYDTDSERVYATYYPTIGFNVNWDETQTDCDAIDGAWTGTSGYSNYACCGDDRMWIYNRALNEEDGFEKPTIDDDAADGLSGDDPTTSLSSYCLYGARDDGDEGLENTGLLYDPATGTYTCESPDFDAYDDNLDEDRLYSYDDEDTFLTAAASKESLFFFEDKGGDEDYETDIGKWSDSSGNNPQFCYYEYDETNGESYQWIDDINEIGDTPVNDQGEEVTEFYDEDIKATTICEKYLGGKWTGGHCCGNKYDYLGTFGAVGYYDESFSEATPIYYNDGATILHQYACLQASVYDEGTTARYTKDDGKTVELLNTDGTWYGCNIEDTTATGTDYYTSASLITDTTNIASCTVQGSYLCNYNYTDSDEDGTPESEEWEWYHLTSGDEGDYVEDVLGYKSGDTFTSNPAVTPWAADEGLQPYGCCAANRCWDGTACVDEYSEYTYTDSTSTEEVVAICYQGSWSGPKETKYDWYANTDAAAVDYCLNSYACVCSTSEDDETYCTDNEEYVVSGCTMTQDFYSKDHFCEAVDTNGDTDFTDDDDSSRWTSRTKLLAFQLLEMAAGTEYTLFCDKYDSAVNNYVDLEPIAEEINSVCILKQDDTITVGITLNSGDMAYPMGADLEETLFDSNGFIDAAVEEEVDNCDDALAEDQTGYRFGMFFSCDGSANVWYNSVLNATIYSKDGLSASPDYPDVDSWQGILDDKKDTVVAYITDNELRTQDGSIELNEEFIGTDEETVGMETIADYNRFYYSTENSATIIGVEDIKYNGESDNRYYMAVLYTGPTLDCDQVYAPYEDTATILCDSTNGIVLERSPEGSAYWRSLTAGFRAE